MELGAMEMIYWEWFKKEFNDHYVPSIVKQQKSKDFANLVQGSMTMKQYATKFMGLGNFNPHHISIESLRMEQFYDVIQEWVRAQVVCLEIKDFQKLVHGAPIAKRE